MMHRNKKHSSKV